SRRALRSARPTARLTVRSPSPRRRGRRRHRSHVSQRRTAMLRPARRSLTLLVVFALSYVAMPGSAHADDADALRRELETLRQQLATLTQSYEQRLKVLGDRLEQLESQRAPAPGSPPATGTNLAVGPPAPAEAAPAPEAPTLA